MIETPDSFPIRWKLNRERSQPSFLNYYSDRSDSEYLGQADFDWIKPIDYKLIKPGIAGIAGVTCVGGGWDISIVLSLKIIIIIIISQSNFLIQTSLNIEYQEIGKKIFLYYLSWAQLLPVIMVVGTEYWMMLNF